MVARQGLELGSVGSGTTAGMEGKCWIWDFRNSRLTTACRLRVMRLEKDDWPAGGRSQGDEKEGIQMWYQPLGVGQERWPWAGSTRVGWEHWAWAGSIGRGLGEGKRDLGGI